MTTTLPITTRHPERPTFSHVGRTALLASIAAAVVNVSIFGIARASGVDFASAVSTRSTTTVTVGAVLAATLFAMVVGWALVALAIRRQRPTLRTVAIVGAGFAAVSTLLPATLDVAASARLVLVALHLVAGMFFVLGVTRLSTSSGRDAA